MKLLKISLLVFILSITVSSQNFWQQINGLYEDVWDICLTRSSYILAITSFSGRLQWSSDNGESWIITSIIGADNYSIETVDDSIFIAGKDHIYVSNDFGNTWIIPADFGILGNHSILYDSTSQTLYAGSESWANGICGIYYSVDSGQNWDLLHSFPIIASRQSINALWVTKTNKNILVNVLYSWPYSVHSQFLKSSDYGVTWEIIVEGSLNTVQQIIEDTSSTLYAIRSSNLMVSEDEGNTWVAKSVYPGWENLAIDHSGRIYLDLTYSYDKGDTWFTLPYSGFQGSLRDIAINHSNRIYAASTQGIFYAEADSIVVSVENNETLKSFYLSQNYPNPFNPSTKIKFTIPPSDNPLLGGARGGLVTLKVYDVLGNEVATLVNEEKPVGEYEVEFDGIALPSGIYFYRLKTGSFIETKKMILLK